MSMYPDHAQHQQEQTDRDDRPFDDVRKRVPGDDSEARDLEGTRQARASSARCSCRLPGIAVFVTHRHER